MVKSRDLITTQRQSRKLISGTNQTAKNRILSFDRTQFRTVTDLLTGHNNLRRHFCITGQINSLLCRRCGAQEETSGHVLSVKPWLHADTQIWAPFLDTEEVINLNLWDSRKGTGLQWLDIGYGAQKYCPEILRAPGPKRFESIYYCFLFCSILFYSTPFQKRAIRGWNLIKPQQGNYLF